MNVFQDVSSRIHHTPTAVFLACLSAMIFMIPSIAVAHRVSLFAWVEGDTVYTQSSFFGGKKIQQGTIEVFDVSGGLLIQGKTNDDGEFSFKAPVKAAMKIVVSAGMGHQAAWNLKASDFETSGSNAPQTEAASSPGAADEQPRSSNRELPSPPSASTGIPSDEIRVIVEKALDKKLAPILHLLLESSGRASMGDILGGIGYIIGLAGLAAYVSSRKKKSNHLK